MGTEVTHEDHGLRRGRAARPAPARPVPRAPSSLRPPPMALQGRCRGDPSPPEALSTQQAEIAAEGHGLSHPGLGDSACQAATSHEDARGHTGLLKAVRSHVTFVGLMQGRGIRGHRPGYEAQARWRTPSHSPGRAPHSGPFLAVASVARSGAPPLCSHPFDGTCAARGEARLPGRAPGSSPGPLCRTRRHRKGSRAAPSTGLPHSRWPCHPHHQVRSIILCGKRGPCKNQAKGSYTYLGRGGGHQRTSVPKGHPSCPKTGNREHAPSRANSSLQFTHRDPRLVPRPRGCVWQEAHFTDGEGEDKARRGACTAKFKVHTATTAKGMVPGRS